MGWGSPGTPKFGLGGSHGGRGCPHCSLRDPCQVGLWGHGGLMQVRGPSRRVGGRIWDLGMQWGPLGALCVSCGVPWGRPLWGLLWVSPVGVPTLGLGVPTGD